MVTFLDDGGAQRLGEHVRRTRRLYSRRGSALVRLDDDVVALVEGSAGGGKVTAVVTGAGDVQTVRISSDVVDPDDVEMLEDLVVAAVGEAMRRAQELQAERMGAVTGGVDLGGLGPGLGGALG